MLCHLANIAYRVGHTIQCDPKNGHVINDPKAQALWGATRAGSRRFKGWGLGAGSRGRWGFAADAATEICPLAFRPLPGHSLPRPP
jgi:hypothetical protein